MSDEIRVLGFAGSLRTGSLNRAALRAAIELAPAGMTIEGFDIAPIPLYNADVEAAGVPEPVARFKAALADADAILVVTPEYNSSVPGVLKNAIDWASRPPSASPLSNKPAAIMGASTGNFGTVRSQSHLRQVLQATNALVMPQPQALIMRAGEKFDAAGRLTDDATRALVAKLLAAFADWVCRMRAVKPPAGGAPSAPGHS